MEGAVVRTTVVQSTIEPPPACLKSSITGSWQWHRRARCRREPTTLTDDDEEEEEEDSAKASCDEGKGSPPKVWPSRTRQRLQHL